jgi:hypothetical protein
MYDKYNQYPELIRLIGAAAVSRQFRQTLSRNPSQILEGGYLGYHFDLTKEEAASRECVGADINVMEWEVRHGSVNPRGRR